MLNDELLAKAKEAKSAEEILTLAKENNIPLTEQEASDYFAKLNTEGELADDELNNVAGGCGKARDPNEVDVISADPKCPDCGFELLYYCNYREDGYDMFICGNRECKKFFKHIYEGDKWLRVQN